MTEEQYIEPIDHKWFFILPNICDESDLDPYEFRLLAHYTRRGECWESVRTTAEICKMSHPSVIEKRRSLEEKGWIKTSKSEGYETINIQIVDKWKDNFDKYSGSLATRVVATLNGSGSQVESKKNHIKNNNIKTDDEKSKVVLLYEDVFGFPPPMMRKILVEVEQQYPMDRIEEAFRMAGNNGARSFSYVRKILEDNRPKYAPKAKVVDRTSDEARKRYAEMPR